MSYDYPTNSDDVIDSRDIIARIDTLRNEITAHSDIDVSLADEIKELKILELLADGAGGSPDWDHGETLISDSYFEDYARELAKDIGAINDNDSWPYTCIDWEKAASELQMDYFSVNFDGVDYWIRS